MPTLDWKAIDKELEEKIRKLRQRHKADLTFNSYQQQAAITSGAYGDGNERVLAAAVCLVGEVGEILNIVKKFIWHGHLMDTDQLKDELGDVLWYLAEFCTAIGIPLEKVAQYNLEKLQKRYPDGFSEERSKNRE